MTLAPGWIKDAPDGATFAVRVVPRAGRTAMVGVMGEGANAALKIALAAPPVEGKANAALVAYLADVLGVSRSRVQVIAGAQSKNKVLRVSGVNAAELAASLIHLLSDNPDRSPVN